MVERQKKIDFTVPGEQADSVKNEHFDSRSVQDKIDMFEAYQNMEVDVPEQVPVRRTVSDITHTTGRSRKEIHLQVRSVTFADTSDDEASKPRLCRTPTPFWRSDSSVSDSGEDEGGMIKHKGFEWGDGTATTGFDFHGSTHNTPSDVSAYTPPKSPLCSIKSNRL